MSEPEEKDKGFTSMRMATPHSVSLCLIEINIQFTSVYFDIIYLEYTCEDLWMFLRKSLILTKLHLFDQKYSNTEIKVFDENIPGFFSI